MTRHRDPEESVLTFWRTDDRILRSRLTDGTDGEPTEWSKAFACKPSPLQAAVHCQMAVAPSVGGRVVASSAFFDTPASHDYYLIMLEQVLSL